MESEAYLETSPTSAMEHFAKTNSKDPCLKITMEHFAKTNSKDPCLKAFMNYKLVD